MSLDVGRRKTTIAVFSRFDSKRLPGKALRSIAGRTLMGRVLDRVSRVPDANVVVATSDRAVDDVIARAASDEGVAVFRGSCDDVLGRASDCAITFGADRLVRISGDSPFIPPELITRMLNHPQASRGALVTNAFPKTFPPGASVEILGRMFLDDLLRRDLDAQDREHVTRYAYQHPAAFAIHNVSAPDDRYAGITLTVDDEEDLARADAIAAFLGGESASADLDAVVGAARKVMT